MQTTTTVAIPVYNEERFIARTLESVVPQADEIIISDNASTDLTSKICQQYAEKFPHIRYHRNPSTINITQNFYQCIDMANSDYFMFLGGHDLLSKNYIFELKTILDSSSSVLAYSNAVHLDSNYAFLRTYKYNFSESLTKQSAPARFLSMIENLSDGTMFHGLYRKNILCECITLLKKYSFSGADHILLPMLSTLGTLQLADNVTYFRISPRDKEADILVSWTRVLKSIHGKDYNPVIHYPESIPASIAEVQFDIARTVAKTTPDHRRYLKKVYRILARRYPSDSQSAKEILRRLQPLLDKERIDTSISFHEKCLHYFFLLAQRTYSFLLPRLMKIKNYLTKFSRI